MKSTLLRTLLFVMLALQLGACSMGQMVARSSVSIMDGGERAMNRETDLVLAESAIPANLKLIEGLIEENPGDSALRLYAAQGFYGYAFGFVEDSDPVRAGALYARAFEHAAFALRQAGLKTDLKTARLDDIETGIAKLGKSAVPALFWSASTLAKGIDMNRSDPLSIAQLGKAAALMRRVLALDETYYHGGPHLFFGVYYGSVAPMFGGDHPRAREHFDKARALNQDRLLIVDVLEAQFLSRQTLDQTRFHDLLTRVANAPDNLYPEMALANAIAKRKAGLLLGKEAAWF